MQFMKERLQKANKEIKKLNEVNNFLDITDEPMGLHIQGYRVGKVVTLLMSSINEGTSREITIEQDAAATRNITELPSGYRPVIRQEQFLDVNSSTRGTMCIRVGTSGQIYMNWLWGSVPKGATFKSIMFTYAVA